MEVEVECRSRWWRALRVFWLMLRRGAGLTLEIRLRRMMINLQLLSKSLILQLHSTLLNHAPHHQHRGSNGLADYEFSCTSSPATPAVKIWRSSKNGGSKSKSKSSMSSMWCMYPAAAASSSAIDEPMSVCSPLSTVAESGLVSVVAESEEEEKSTEAHGVDREAEEFIARFYEQMQLQRQMSLVRYRDMLERGAS